MYYGAYQNNWGNRRKFQSENHLKKLYCSRMMEKSRLSLSKFTRIGEEPGT